MRSCVGLDHEVAETRPGRDRDLDLVLALLGRLGLRDELVVRGDARLALGLAGARRQPHPFELALQRAAAGLVDLLLLREPLLLLFEPARVVAFPRDARAAVELEDPARDVVEEVAVVGHRDDGAVVVLQVPFEPRDRLRVEMVRRLVEQQQVGLAEQQAAQRDPAALATAQLRHVGVGGREPQRVHRDVELTIEIPAADVVDLVLEIRLLREELVEVGVGLAHRVADLLEPVEEVLRARDALDDVAEHVLGGVEPRLLG